MNLEKMLKEITFIKEDLLDFRDKYKSDGLDDDIQLVVDNVFDAWNLIYDAQGILLEKIESAGGKVK